MNEGGAMDKFKNFLGSGFGLGLMPIVPGSFGALPGLALHLALWWAAAEFGWGDLAIRAGCLAGAVITAVVHYWLTPWAQAYWGDPDPRHFVLDEIVGYLFVPVFAFPIVKFEYILLGFVLFRIFDAIKLPGARYIDRNIHTASGVLFDDVVSAAYSAVALSAVMYFYPQGVL
ncbi:MAG: phosphatidylglycerophosphatase A [Kiritimatiellae bacterium]|nr:phosphatidylglycerophosphatase A [Kiritimatiellia bacterium]